MSFKPSDRTPYPGARLDYGPGEGREEGRWRAQGKAEKSAATRDSEDEAERKTAGKGPLLWIVNM